MTDALVAFLKDRLDDDERVARAATEGPWRVDSEDFAEAIYDARNQVVVGGGRWGGEASVFDTTEDAIHIARHDPARTLREVEAKRGLLDLHRQVEDPQEMQDYCTECDLGRDKYPYYPCTTLRLLAAVYADHPDYLPGWQP
ncbi:DUF6221 family protein [Streptomyces microflavus]|uniref:DUF6221 family protein n=1 Tax=Streptomyces microflavus TaxID=1919 RepID=UPI002E30B4D0|nr:DUF6221 family protein [Streptomyces microflavus]